jgi:two-component system response regulator FixJ
MTAQAAPKAPHTVVIVEDSDAVRRSLELLLRTRGYVVEAYRTGADMLAALPEGRIDCLLIDFKMPKIDGVELLRQLRDLGIFAPALMVTGWMSNDLKIKAMGAGYLDVIEKPPSKLVLVDKLEAAIAGRLSAPGAA